MPVTTSGDVYPFGAGVFSGLQDSLTIAGSSNLNNLPMGVHADAGYITAAPTTRTPNYLAWIGGFFLVIVALHFIQRHEKVGIEGKLTGINLHNWVVNGILVMSFLIAVKILVNKYLSNVKGLSDLVNMV